MGRWLVMALVAGAVLTLPATNSGVPWQGQAVPELSGYHYELARATLLPILPTRPADRSKLHIPPAFEIERAFLVCQSGYAIGLEVWGTGNQPLRGQMVTLLAVNSYQEFGWAQRELVGWGGDFKAQLILGLVPQMRGYKAAVVWQDKAWWAEVGPCATRDSLPE